MSANYPLDQLYRLQRLFWRVLRPRTRGVKVMLFDRDNRLVLVRNAYGRADLFVLPGGGVRPFEQPAKAAVREMREELGVDVAELKFRSEHQSATEGKRDRIYLFEGRVTQVPRIASVELADVTVAPLSKLPASTSPATKRRVAEYEGRRAADGSW